MIAYQPIENYGITGNLHTVALVSLKGSIDWFCFPYIDSPSVFCALLDSDKGGCLAVRPREDFDSISKYLDRTNILITRFRTPRGVMKLIDFMPVPRSGPEEKEEERHVLYRLVEIEEGEMDVELIFMPRFHYAEARTGTRPTDHGVMAEGDNRSLALTCTHALDVSEDSAGALWTLNAGDKLALRLGSTGRPGRCCALDLAPVTVEQTLEELQETKQYWRTWLDRHETGRSFFFGPYQDMVERSTLALKLLYYQPVGTIAAAATTSLPEEIGGTRNWDYRYTWIRDASFTLEAFFNTGHLSEMEGYLRWIDTLLSEQGPASLQIMYSLRGETDLEETELSHLDGYKGSRPVRAGNGAAGQRQLDVYGELMNAALKLSNYAGKINARQWEALRQICDHVAVHWGDRDSGIWEMRCEPRHFVHSKVMCWVALDRGITIAERYGFEGDLETWRAEKEKIHAQVCLKGFNEDKQAFVQYYGSDELDASNLLIPILGFLPFHDQRVVSTVEAISRELSHDGLLYRYLGEDGIKGGEGTFLLCSFWLVDCFAGMDRVDEAEALLKKLESTASHLGLFSEQYDVNWRQALGNFPQAFTHIGYINSVSNLLRSKEKPSVREEKKDHSLSSFSSIKGFFQRFFFSAAIELNQGTPDHKGSSENLVEELKSTMNLLRGAFFDTFTGRVAYERIKGSELYEEYEKASRSLQEFDPANLKSREEKLAFWINMYNLIVIHGVIELGIRDSVKEIPGFFRRICYVIGGLYYTPDHIEHGILRANKRPPHTLFPLLAKNDPRLRHSLKRLDPRIHFALVCASSSCPPIEVYSAENLDEELDQAGKSFLKGGGLVLNKENKEVSLSRVFLWYGKDFGRSERDLLSRLADFVYDHDEREFLKRHAHELTVNYQKYDWRLNRGDIPS